MQVTEVTTQQERYRGARARIAELNASLLQSLKNSDIDPQHLKLHPDIYEKLKDIDIMDIQAIYCIGRPLFQIKTEHWIPGKELEPLRDADSALAKLLVDLYQWIVWTESIHTALVMSITGLSSDKILRLGQYRISQIIEWSTQVPVSLLKGGQPAFWDVLQKCDDLDNYNAWGASAWWMH